MNYKYYPSTFPNLDVIRPNISFYHNAGARGVLMVWQKGTAELELGALREKLICAVLSDPGMSPDCFDSLKDEIISELYGYSADALREYITKFRDVSAEHFTVFSKPSEILPVNRAADGAYDLTLAKEFANLWESVYRRHASPDPAYTGMEMTAFEKAYLNSDYYLPLHSRVQFIEWLNGNIEQKDRNAVFSEIAASYEK